MDCLTDLKERFQRFVDGQNTFEELTHAVRSVVLNCSHIDVIDFLSSAHRDGLMSGNHYKTLIDDISVIPERKSNPHPNHRSNFSNPAKLPKELTVLNNRFVLGRIIGKGGMGVVYKARDLRKMEVNDSDDVVAIKILSADLRAQPEYLIALQREAKKAQKLAHPNIVTVYDFDRDGDIAYMTMEYLDGIPLSKIIEAYAPLPRKEAIRIIRNIVRGLSYAHKHRIVHSDLKPSNIFLLKNGMLKILDFGLARAFQTPDDKSAHAITNFYLPHSAFTPAYASCEIIENIPPTPKDDVYALGCIAHELLTKKHPYDRVFANIAKKENLTVKQNKHLTPIEHRAISCAVELDKNKRTESANDFLRDIVGVTSTSFWSGYSIKTLIIAAVTLVTIVGIYTVYKLITYETINAKQAIIVNQYEIEKNLEKAEYYMQSNRDHIQGENNALILYQDVLKIDPDNVRAKSGIENINKQLASNQVSNLLDKARREEALKHYVRPENENAYNTYLEVLKLNQNQVQALHGIDRIRNSILNEAEILMQKNKLDKAELYIKDALMIYPGNLDAVKLYSKLKAKRLSDNDQQIKDKNITEPSDIINYPSNEERIDDFIQQIPEERLSASERRLIKLHGMKAEYFVNKGINYSADNKNSTFYFKRILEIDSRNEYAKKGIDNAWLSLIENINHEFEVNDSLVAIEKLEKLKDLFLPYYDVKTLISALSSKKAKRLSGSDRRRSIAFHLTKAKIHLEADRLTLPKGNNAVESYLEVLNLDLHNNEARSGLKTIESILSERIRKEIDQKQYSKANDELKQALEVFPESKILNDIKRIIVDSQKNSHQGLDIKKQISDLTDKALNALDKRRYIFPIGRSAYDYYSNINSIKPNDSVGIRGLNIAKLRAYDQIYSDIANNNYQIAYLRIDRLSKLGITDKRLSELRAKLIEADRSYKDATLDLTQYGNYLLYLLMYAKQKEAEGVIWPPLSNNAFNIYSHVHDIEPLNNAAKQALARLFKNRIMNIKELLDNRRLNEAESELLLLDNHYNGKSEKKLLSSMRNELNTLKNINIQF